MPYTLGNAILSWDATRWHSHTQTHSSCCPTHSKRRMFPLWVNTSPTTLSYSCWLAGSQNSSVYFEYLDQRNVRKQLSLTFLSHPIRHNRDSKYPKSKQRNKCILSTYIKYYRIVWNANRMSDFLSCSKVLQRFHLYFFFFWY